jgi:hypothetical protein
MEHKCEYPTHELKLGKIIGGEVTIENVTYRPFNAAGYGGRFDGKLMCFAVTDDGLAFIWGTPNALAAKEGQAEPTHVFIPAGYRTGDWRWWQPEGWVSPAERPKEQRLEDLTKAQLLQMASDQGMDATKMNKADIIAAIRAAEVAEVQANEQPQTESDSNETPVPQEPVETPGDAGAGPSA